MTDCACLGRAYRPDASAKGLCGTATVGSTFALASAAASVAIGVSTRLTVCLCCAAPAARARTEGTHAEVSRVASAAARDAAIDCTGPVTRLRGEYF